MKLLKSGLLVVLLGSLFTACEMETPDGRIPQEYVAHAQKLVGDYKGRIGDSGAGTLSIRLNGNKVVAKFSGSLLGCNAKIGDLQSVDGSESGLSRAVFALSASCVEGRHLVLTASGDQRTFQAQVLSSTTVERVCPTEREIGQCEGVWAGRDSECESEENSTQRRWCIEGNRRSAQACSSCDDRSQSYYVYGSFRR